MSPTATVKYEEVEVDRIGTKAATCMRYLLSLRQTYQIIVMSLPLYIYRYRYIGACLLFFSMSTSMSVRVGVLIRSTPF